MPRTLSITLDEHLTDFVDIQISRMRYDSANAVISAGLRLLQEQELRIQNLRNAISAGEKSGQLVTFDPAGFKKAMRNEWECR